MSLFAVTRAAGPGWADGQGAFGQPEVVDHTAFMNSLAHEGFALLAGPVAGSEQDRIRVLMIVESASETESYRRLAEDPWEHSQQLVTSSVGPRNLFHGADRVVALPAIQ